MTVKKLSKIIKTKTICLCLMFFAYVSAYSQPFGGGAGTQQDPYQLSTKEHLQELSDTMIKTSGTVHSRNWTWNKHFRLMNDITDSVDFVIGGFRNEPFYGSFYGGGNKITLAINDSFHSGVALFRLLQDGSIDSLVVDGYVKIKKFFNSCNIISSAIYVAGIVASSAVTTWASRNYITNCISNATIDISDGVWLHAGGGVLGRGVATTLINCINNGNIIGPKTIASNRNNRLGGIVAELICSDSRSNIYNCLNLGVLDGTNIVGGIAGEVDGRSGNVSILGNTNQNFIKGNKSGGIVGFVLSGTTVSNNFNSGVVEGASNIGCIVGSKGTGTNIIIENNHYDKQMCGDED